METVWKPLQLSENGKINNQRPNLSDSFDIRPLSGGDKPRHYKRRFTGEVGAGFIPARELACN
jgi:hypothetical protein